jgi:RNA polymerase sigma-70 factor, ECF subfamily
MPDAASLGRLFLAALDPQPPPGSIDATALGARLVERIDRCRRLHPGVDLADEDFVHACAARVARGAEPGAALERLHADDLWLALACAGGDARALDELRTQHLTEIATAIAGVEGTGAGPDDVLQQLLLKHFVAGDRGPAAGYAARGPLGGWLRIAATRLALDMRRKQRRHASTPPERVAELAGAAGDPEMAWLKERYAEPFEAAVAAAFAALAPRERNVLRLRHVDGLSIDEIGALYHVHRATAARWIAAARDAVLTGTRVALAERIPGTPSEIESLLRLVQSGLDLSIAAHLANG